MKRIVPLILSLAFTANLYAVRTEKFSDSTFLDFSQGTANGVTISEEGLLQIGPNCEKYSDIPASVIWAMASDGKDKLYVGAGNQGQIFKVKQGQALEFFKADELQVQTLTVDSSGNLYAGTIPDGKVYKISPDGKSSVFFEPKERYIWALQFDDAGNLFVATGENGKLFKVDPQGNGSVFYDSTESHLRTLLFDSKKRLWAGSEESGLVFRFDNLNESEGHPIIAYDSPLKEIKAICERSDGTIFAAAMGERDRAFSSLKSISPPAGSKSSQNSTGHENESRASTMSSSSSDSETGLGEIVHILEDGTTERWWSDTEDVYALGSLPNGHLWAGTNKKGKLIELSAPREFKILGQLESETITALNPTPEGKWFAATSNIGAVWEISFKTARTGTYLSRIFDTRGPSRWGKFSYQQPEKAPKCKIFTRTGNTNKADKAWNDWVPLGDDQKIKSSIARFIQYKIEFQSNGSSTANEPALDSVTLFYQTKNLSPTISRVTIHAPHNELIRISKDSSSSSTASPSTQNPSSSGAKTANADSGGDSGGIRNPNIQQNKKLGWRAATWQTSDPNNDDLSFQVYYRMAGAAEWKLLKDDIRDTLISWDASTWRDGVYYLKVVASDAIKNLEGEERSDEIISGAFTVDHEAPKIQYESASAKSNTLKLKITDTTSVVDEAQYCIDGERWKPLLPVSGIYDSTSNDFEISLSDLSSGEHYINIRASDSSDNISSVTIQFKR